MKTIVLSYILTLIFLNCAFAQAEKYPLQIGGGDRIGGDWSPRNDLILSSSGDDNALRLWEISTGKVLWKSDYGFLQDETELYIIVDRAWSKDQKYILTGSANGKIQLWNAADGKLLWNIRAHRGSIDGLAISPDMKKFVSIAETSDLKSDVKAWNLADGKLLKDFGENKSVFTAVGFLDNDLFQTGDSSGQIAVRSISKGGTAQTKQLNPCVTVVKGHLQVVYSSNFRYLAAQCENRLLITDVRTGKIVKRIPKEKHYKLPVFSENEQILLLPDTIDSKIYDFQTGKLTEHDEFDEGALNFDGSLIVTSSYGTDGIQIVETKTGRLKNWLVGHPGIIKSLAFSNSGKLFASGSNDRVVRIWDSATGKILLSLEGHNANVEAVGFSPDDKFLTSKSETETIVWNAQTGARISATGAENKFPRDGGGNVSRDGRRALIEEYGKPFRLVNLQTQSVVKEFVYIDQLDNLVFTPDENYFLAKPWWGGWRLWSVETGKPLREFEIGYSNYNRVAFHPDGKTFITGGEGENIFMFNLETGEMLWSLFPIDREEFEQKKAWEARRVGVIKRRENYAAQADADNLERVKKVSVKFSHYGTAESFWDQKIAGSGEPDKSKLKLSREKATVAWFTLTNEADLPVVIDTNGMMFNPKCRGLCDGAEISSRYVIELKDGETRVNGFDMYAKTLLPPQRSVYFSVALEHFAASRAIYLGFTFQKDNPDDKSYDDYGTEQKVYLLREADLPK